MRDEYGVLLRNSTIDGMMAQCAKIQAHTVIWLIILVVSTFSFVLFFHNKASAVLICLTVAVFIASVASITMNAMRVRGLRRIAPQRAAAVIEEDDDEEEGSYTSRQDYQGRATGLENRRGNTIMIGVLKLQPVQWRALVDELKRTNGDANKILWSRRRMEKHNMPEIDNTDWDAFVGLTAKNARDETKFKALTKELQRLDIVNREGTRITDYGWGELCRAAGLRVVL